jgi:membrane protein
MKKKVKEFVKNFFDVMGQPEMLILPGQLAFFFILSVVPIFTLISYGATYLNLSIDFIIEFISREFGSDIANLIIPAVTDTSLSKGFFITLFIGYIIASNGASSMIVTSNTIYGIKDKGFLHRRIKSFIMTLFIVILFLFILIVPLFGDKIVSILYYINLDPSITTNIEFIISILKGPISWIIIFFFIKVLYAMAPDTNLPSNKTTYGALFTSFGWIISTTIYSYYINHYAHYSVFYGGLANLIILMLWVYLLANIFTIGMALNYRKDILKVDTVENYNIPKNTKNKNNKKTDNNIGNKVIK